MPDLSLNACLGKYCLAYSYAILFYIPLVLLLIFILRKSFIQFKNVKETEAYERKRKENRFLLTITRSIILLFILIAIASPFTTKEITVPGDPSLILLVDNSTSFDLFDRSIIDDLQAKLERHIPIEVRYIGRGDKSAIGDGVLNYAQGDTNLLLITDGQNNVGRDLGDMALFASKLNTTISALNVEPIKGDIGVSIEGPLEVIQDTENAFNVKVNKAGPAPGYTLEVAVDDKTIITEANGKTQTFTQKFSAGYHRIVAKVIADDYFKENNIFYKTVEVVPRPKALFITEKASPLYDALAKIYDMAGRTNLPDNYEDYSTIILNDLPAETVNPWVEKLTSYVSEKGNGLVVIGGERSYNKGNYKNSLVETLLPVQVGTGRKTKDTDINIVVVMDISGSTGMGFEYGSGNAKIDVEKGLTLGVLSDIMPEHKVAVAVFNTEAYLISPLTKITEKRNLTDRILSVQDGGGTIVLAGLRKAKSQLLNVKGSKNIILISDGVTMFPDDALKEAELMAKEGIKLFAVGVGRGSTDVNFMKKLAEKGNGLYFEPEEHQRLKLFFGEEPEEKKQDIYNLIVLDGNHFITKDIELRASITGLNFVVPKSVAKTLVVTDENSPIVTAWRFGLGRVASITTDDGNKWAGSLLSKTNSQLLTKTINWAVGDLSRNKVFDVDIQDTSMDKAINVEVISKEIPKVQGVAFSKADNNLFAAALEPGTPGFHDFMGATYAVNYNSEYLNLGLNPALKDLTAVTGGKMFNPDDIQGMVEDVKSFSKRIKVDAVYYRWPFAVMALLLLLGEITVRRLRENRMKKIET